MSWINTFRNQSSMSVTQGFNGQALLRVLFRMFLIWRKDGISVFLVLIAIPSVLVLLLTLLDSFPHINMVWSFLVLVMFGASCGWIGTRLNKLFQSESLILEQVTSIFRQSLLTASNQEDVLDNLTENLSTLLQPEHLSVWRYHHHESFLTLLRFASARGAQIRLAELPFDIEPEQLRGVRPVSALPESALRQGLETADVKVAIALDLGEELIGILGLGKISLGPNEQLFLQALNLIVGQLALVVKNSCLIGDLTDTIDKLQQAYRRTIDVEEDERRRLATELHDDILGRLTSMTMSLRISQRRLTTDPTQVHYWLEMLSEELSYLKERLREITQGLHPAILTDLGLIPALQSYLDSLAKQVQPDSTACMVSLTAQGFNHTRLSEPKLERDLYYITRQALDNALSHAHTEQIFIHLRWREDSISVTVQDMGCGLKDIPQALMGQNGHLGLLSMHERAIAWGGQLTFYSPPGQGTTVLAHIPTSQSSHEPTHLQAFTRQLTARL